jgi:hypothetical protein
LCRLVLHGPTPPIYTANIRIRTAIDTVQTAWWLTGPMSTEVRIKGLVAELLYSADEMVRVKSDASVHAAGEARQTAMLEYAAARSWQIVGGETKRSVGGEARLTFRKFLQAEMNDPVAVHGVWSHLSAVTHGSYHGLVQSIDGPSADDGVAIAGSNTDALSSRLELAARLVVSATMQFLSYTGWRSPRVDAAADAVIVECNRRGIVRLERR